MAIEVDYFAWEKWQHLTDNLYHFGKNPDVKNGILIASVSYFRAIPKDIKPIITASYSFWAENETAPITKLLCCSWQNRKTENGFLRHYYYDEIDIDEAAAQNFHQDFSALPVLIEATVDYMPIGNENYMYRIGLGLRYGNKSYHWDTGSSNFLFPNGESGKIWDTSIKGILNRCEVLNARRYPKTENMREAIRAYEKSFKLKVKNRVTPSRWPKHRDLEVNKHENFSQTKKLLEKFPNLDLPEWEKLLEFKHYLPYFLECMAFDAEFTSEYEAILFTKLKESGLLDWDEDERKAINDYFLALLKYSLSYYPSITVATSSILLWFIKLDFDLAPYLSYWDSSLVHIDSLRHLGAFLKKLIEENLTDSLPETLSSWLNQANIEKMLEDAIAVYEGKRPYAHEFGEALENLRLIRA